MPLKMKNKDENCYFSLVTMVCVTIATKFLLFSLENLSHGVHYICTTVETNT